MSQNQSPTPDQILNISESQFSGFHPQALDILMTEMEKLQAYGDPNKLNALLTALSNPANSIADLVSKLKNLSDNEAYNQEAIESIAKLKERILNVILLQTMRIGRNANEMTRDGAIDPMESNALQIQFGVLKFMLSFIFVQYSERQIILAMTKLQQTVKELNISEDVIPFVPLMLRAVYQNIDRQIKFFSDTKKVSALNQQVKEAGTNAYMNSLKRRKLGSGQYDPDANVMMTFLMSDQFKALDDESYRTFRPMTALVIASDGTEDNDAEIIKIMPEIQRELESQGKHGGKLNLMRIKEYLRENIHERVKLPRISLLPITVALIFIIYLIRHNSGSEIELGNVYKREVFKNDNGKLMNYGEIRKFLEEEGIVKDIKDEYGTRILKFYSDALDEDKVGIPSQEQIDKAVQKIQNSK